MEVLGPTEAEAGEDASLMGWRFVGSKHTCPDCQSGNLPAAAKARAVFGTDSVVIPEAPRDVAEGEDVLAEGGIKVGRAAHAAKKGEPLRIALVVPGPGGRQASPAPDDEVGPPDLTNEGSCGGQDVDGDAAGLKIEEAPIQLGGGRATRWEPGDAN